MSDLLTDNTWWLRCFEMQRAVNMTVPEPLQYDKPQTWSAWIQRFERFLQVAKIHTEADDIKISNLIYYLGSRAEEILATFTWGEGERTRYDAVRQKYEDYFMVARNIIIERAVFNARCQMLTETVDDYITDLYSLAQTLKYGNMKEELIRDRIVVGIRDEKLSQKLQLMPELTLKKAVEMVKQSERVKLQQELLKTENSQPGNVMATQEQLPNQR